MANKTDATHSNNVANFNELIISVTGFNNSYNPTKESIKLPALQGLAAKASEVLQTYNTALAAQKNAIAARDASIKILSPLATKIKNAVAATDTTQQVDDNVKSIIRKIQGQRASTKKTEEEKTTLKAAGKEVVEISSSQMSIESRLDNFDKLIKLLASINLYAPNEEELKITSLEKYYNELKTLNAATQQANITLNNARIARDEIFYKPDTGLCDIALSVKTYIKSVFGATSPQLKQISGLKFTKKKA